MQGTRVPPQIRVMVGIVACPLLLVIGYQLMLLFTGQWTEVSISGVIFSLLGVFAYYLVIIGKLPRFFSYRSGAHKAPDR